MPSATVNGVQLHYSDSGESGSVGPGSVGQAGTSGPPVVLLHAFPLSSAMWDAQVAALAGRWRVVAPDLRGFGLSEAPDDVAGYSMAAFADDVAALVERLGLAPVVVVGLSMGGYMAFELLRRHRHLVRAVVLADTRAAADTPEAAERRRAQQDQVRSGLTAAVLDALIGGLLAEPTRQGRPDVVASVRSMMEATPPQGIVGALEAMRGRPDATAELAGMNLPVLVVVGDQDALSPPAVARAMAESLPDARLAIIEGAGHLSNLEAPEAFNQALVGFLDEVGSR